MSMDMDIKLYTIEEASNIVGVSKQAIYKQIKKKEFLEFIVKKGRITHLTEEGLEFLKGGSDPNIETINSQKNEILELKKEKDRLLNLLEQQNNIILNSQGLMNKTLSATEYMLLQKREELLLRQEIFDIEKKRKFNVMNLFSFFKK